MKVDPEILEIMLESMSEGTGEMREILRGRIDEEAIHSLGRVAHKLKGEATVVGFTNLSSSISHLEDSLGRLRSVPQIRPSHVQVVSNYLSKIIDTCRQIQKSAFRATVKKNPKHEGRGISAILEILAKTVNQGCGKQSILNFEHFNIQDIPKIHRGKVQDVLIQLIRNAIVHGIELPNQREAVGKSPCGCIALSTRRSKYAVYVSVRDNGGGVNLHAIRKRLIEKYKYTHDRIEHMSRVNLLSSLFLPGFSTLDEVHQHAGRGVGLDLVREHSKLLGGMVDVSFEENEYTEFTIQFPIQNTTSSNLAQRRNQNDPPQNNKRDSGSLYSHTAF